MKFDELIPNIIADFENEYSIKDIAKRNKLNTSQVYYVLRMLDVKIPKKEELDEFRVSTIKIEYKKGKSLDYLSQKYKITKASLYRIINSVDISDLKKQMVLILSKGGFKDYAIARRLSITTKKVKEILKDYQENSTEKLLKRVGLTKEEVIEIRNRLSNNRLSNNRLSNKLINNL